MVTYHLTAAGGGADTNLTNVSKLRVEKASQVDTFGFPGDDSDATYADDMYGVTRKISVEGTLADTAANLQTFIKAIEGMIDGAQMDDATKVVFHSDVPNESTSGTTYTVVIERFVWELNTDTPGGLGGLSSTLKYTIDMVQSAN